MACPDEVLAAVDHVVRIPILGRAESLNLATAAAVCLYAKARIGRAAERRQASAGLPPRIRSTQAVTAASTVSNRLSSPI